MKLNHPQPTGSLLRLPVESTSRFFFRMPYSRLASGPKGVDAYILSSSSGADNSGRAPLTENELARRIKPNRKPNSDTTQQARNAEVELEYARAVRSCKRGPKNLVELVPEAPVPQRPGPVKDEFADEVNSEPVTVKPRNRKRARVLDQVKELYGDSGKSPSVDEKKS